MSTWDNWEFKTDKVVVAPFAPGQTVYVDGMLSTLYYQTREAGVMENVFCGDNPSHDQFIRIFDESKRVLQILCEMKNAGEETETITPVGYCWVELPKGVDGERAAMCAFAFFKKSRYIFDMGMLGIAYWMKGLKINVLHGVALESNKAAAKYSDMLGFKESAIVPRYHFHEGKLVPARAVSIDDRDFLPRYEAWKSKQNRVESAS